jgi:CRP-like cAMP-binding protein
MKYLGKNQENKVKMMKYIKIADLIPYYYFGNFEMIDVKPHRVDTARCENDNTLLMVINKKSYSTTINDLQKDKRNKEINFLHNYFYFKIINKIHFESKMFIKFKINIFLKGNILINQDEKINNFIFIREGTIETSINNISLLELTHKIKILYDFIVKKAKEYDINIKDIIDFDVTLNHKTTLQFQLIEDFLKQKQNFILSICENGSFGDYELFFNVPSFITATIISKSGKVYFYNYEDFKKVNEEVHAFNETLKEISFSKLKSMLKRMITIYNSTFAYNIKQIETKLIEKENQLKKLNSSKSIKEEGDSNSNYINEPPKHFSSPISLFTKNTINRSNVINTYNDFYNKTNFELKGKNTYHKKIKSIIFFHMIQEKLEHLRLIP